MASMKRLAPPPPPGYRSTFSRGGGGHLPLSGTPNCMYATPEAGPTPAPTPIPTIRDWHICYILIRMKSLPH
jgi:hypothetical protein